MSRNLFMNGSFEKPTIRLVGNYPLLTCLGDVSDVGDRPGRKSGVAVGVRKGFTPPGF